MLDDRFAGESVELYRSAIEALCEAFIIEDTSRRVLACNDKAASVLGLTREALLDPVPFDARLRAVREDGTPIPPDEHPVARAIATRTPQENVVIGIYRADGSLVWVRGAVRLLFRAGDDAPHAVVTSFSDVTAERRLRDALDEREQALKGARALIESLFHAVPDYVFLKDPEGRYRAANQATCDYFGVSLEGALGRTDEELVDVETAAAFRAQDRMALEDGAAHGNEEWLVYRDGRRVLVETKKRPVYNADGTLIGVLGISRDITARKQAEVALADYKLDLERLVAARSAELLRSRDELALANLELHKAMRAKDEFLATMSHELRTPLSSMLMISEAVQEGVYGPLAQRQREALDTLDKSGRRLSALIADILDLARISAGVLGVEPVACDANEIARRAVSRVSSLAKKKDIVIAESRDAESVVLHADPRRLEQILVNLLDNAVKFTPRAGSVGIDVARDPADGVVRLTVWDTGPGIAPENRARVFEPFTQLDSRLARGHAGSGLGLALVRALVDLHGGRVSLASRTGSETGHDGGHVGHVGRDLQTSSLSGCRFVVALPWVQPPRG